MPALYIYFNQEEHPFSNLMVIVPFHLKTAAGCKLFEYNLIQHFRLKLFEDHYFKMANSTAPWKPRAATWNRNSQGPSPQPYKHKANFQATWEYLKTLLLLLITTKSQFIGKDPDVRKNWGQEEKGTIEGEMVGWHYQLNEYESESCSVMSNSLWPHGL